MLTSALGPTRLALVVALQTHSSRPICHCHFQRLSQHLARLVRHCSGPAAIVIPRVTQINSYRWVVNRLRWKNQPPASVIHRIHHSQITIQVYHHHRTHKHNHTPLIHNIHRATHRVSLHRIVICQLSQPSRQHCL